MSLSSMRKLGLLILCLLLIPLSQLGAQANSQKVGFDTIDGVKIEGTYYPSTKGNKAACVLILHDFDKMGGTSRTDEWDSLAANLQKKGYAVLSFDFRGFGQSTGVNPNFWKAPQNQIFKGAKSKQPPATITYKEFQFQPLYQRQLVNDIAAAKAWLDNENDAGTLNSRNLVVVGAGQGATLGLMWMDAEFKRHRGIQVFEQIGVPPVPGKLDDESAGNDLIAAVFLSISPSLGNQGMPIAKWCQEVGKAHKLPMAFIHGEEKSDRNYLDDINYLKAIYPDFKRGQQNKDKDLKFTGEKTISAKLTGSKLLQTNLDTSKFVIEEYLDPLTSSRTPAQWKKRDNKSSYFFWQLPGTRPILAWIKNEDVPQALPFSVVGLR